MWPGDLLVGEVIDGYQIRRRLGHGGMAHVYVAYQPSVQREVAVKILRPDLIDSDPAFFTRFEREARLMASLEHVHILPIIDFGQVVVQDKRVVYLVMRLLDSSLGAYINQRHPLPLEEIARMLGQVAQALDYAHAHGVIHRDLKPANILLDNRGNCFLSDFGIAHLIHATQNLTADNLMIGTPGYMSPEQVMGRTITPASDIYALGVTLYEMLCNRLPFTGDTPLVVINHHVQTKPLPPDSWRSDLPKACGKVVLRALAKVPDERYQAAQEMSEAFMAAVAEPRPVQPPPIDGNTFVGDLPTPKLFLEVEPPAEPQTALVAPAKAGVSRRRWRWLVLPALAAALIVGYALLTTPRGDPVALNNAGLDALAKLDYTTAIHDFEEAIRINGSYAPAYLNLGIAYEEQGNLAEARRAYETSLKYDSRLLMTHYRLAELLLDENELEAGFQAADSGIRVLQMGNLELAESTRQALSFLLFTSRARAYLMRKTSQDLALAENDVQQALAYKDAVPYPAAAYYILAQVYAMQQKPEQAQQAWLDMLANYDENSARQREWAVQAQNALSNNK